MLINRSYLKRLILLGMVLVGNLLFSQEKVDVKLIDSIVDAKLKQQQEVVTKETNSILDGLKKTKFFGLFETRYVYSLTDNVNYSGVHNDKTNAVSNTFDLRRIRLGLKSSITDKIEVGLLANFADFKGDPSNRVIENAYIKYKANKYLNITLGQFRPIFGLEEIIPADFLRSLDYSNQYNAFGANGWESFQQGVAIDGAVDLGKIPVTYAFTVTNGAGRVRNDIDEGKLYSSRIAFGLHKKTNLNLGLNMGAGEIQNQKVYALGVDLTNDYQLSPKLKLEMQLEAKQGVNADEYFKIPVATRPEKVTENLMRGFYFLPNLQYHIGSKLVENLNFSVRYEYWDADFKKDDSNIKQTITPMVGVDFLPGYNARMQVGLQMDNYKRNVANTSAYDSNLLVVQFLVRY